jgi:rhodanese-related sulfurtransferase
MPTLIDRSRVREMLKSGAQLVEVLPRREYDEEHLPGAISIPLRELNRTTTSQLDKSRPVITYCYDYQ